MQARYDVYFYHVLNLLGTALIRKKNTAVAAWGKITSRNNGRYFCLLVYQLGLLPVGLLDALIGELIKSSSFFFFPLHPHLARRLTLSLDVDLVTVLLTIVTWKSKNTVPYPKDLKAREECDYWLA